MNTYRVRFQLGSNFYVEEVNAPSTDAAWKLFHARYPTARILSVCSI